MSEEQYKVDENSVFTACAKCLPPQGQSGKVHPLQFEGNQLMCQNPECRFNWSEYFKEQGWK
jgi:hypothetical protein